VWDWSDAVGADRMPREQAEDVGVGIQGAATAQARCDARLLELVGEFDAGLGWAWFDGITSCAHWLTWACSMGPGAAREHLRVARALRSMPMVAARFAEGEFTYSKVRELTRVAGRVEEAELCELASLQTASQLARTVRRYRAQDGTHLAHLARRRLSWRETDDGMVRLSVTLLPEEAAVLRGAVEAATDRQLDTPDSVDSPGATDSPGTADAPDVSAVLRPAEPAVGSESPGAPSPEREVDRPVIDPVAGLCEVARGYLETVPATYTDDPHLVVVHVDAESLASVGAAADVYAADVRAAEVSAGGDGPDDVNGAAGPDVPAGTSGDAGPRHGAGRAWVERGGPVEVATAARHACDGRVVGMIIDRNGDVLAMGRTRRLASPSQRRALRVRDRSCQFPGCAQHRRLKAHHIVSWAQGGPTDLSNLVLLCQAHHTYVHEGGVSLTGRPGAWEFTLPDGRTMGRDGPATAGARPDPEEIDEIVRSAVAAAAAQPDRVFPSGAGAGFRLTECVQRLFDIQLPAAA